MAFLLVLALKHSAEVLARALQQEKAAMSLTEKVCVLGEIPSGVSDPQLYRLSIQC